MTVTLPGGGLTNGQTIDVNFKLNVLLAGSFRFFVNVAALPGPPSAPVSEPPVKAKEPGASSFNKKVLPKQ